MSDNLPDEENPYQSPDRLPDSPAGPWYRRLSMRWVLAIFLLTGLCLLMALTQGIRTFFVEFDVELPLLAQVALSPMALFGAILLLLLTLVKELFRFSSRWRSSWDIGVILITLVGGALYLLGILVPFFATVQALAE